MWALIGVNSGGVMIVLSCVDTMLSPLGKWILNGLPAMICVDSRWMSDARTRVSLAAESASGVLCCGCRVALDDKVA